MHQEWADVGTIVQLSLHENGFRRRPIAGSIALNELYRVSYFWRATDGRRRRDRYRERETPGWTPSRVRGASYVLALLNDLRHDGMHYMADVPLSRARD